MADELGFDASQQATVLWNIPDSCLDHVLKWLARCRMDPDGIIIAGAVERLWGLVTLWSRR